MPASAEGAKRSGSHPLFSAAAGVRQGPSSRAPLPHIAGPLCPGQTRRGPPRRPPLGPRPGIPGQPEPPAPDGSEHVLLQPGRGLPQPRGPLPATLCWWPRRITRLSCAAIVGLLAINNRIGSPSSVWVVEAVDRERRRAGQPCVVGEAIFDATSREHQPDPLAIHVPGLAMVHRTGAPSRFPIRCAPDPYESGGVGPP
jgi:hypothetical protein